MMEARLSPVTGVDFHIKPLGQYDGLLQSVQQASLIRMDELTGAEIRRSDSYRVGTGDIDASTLALVEELCQRYAVNNAIVPAAYNAGYLATDRWLRESPGLQLDRRR